MLARTLMVCLVAGGLAVAQPKPAAKPGTGQPTPGTTPAGTDQAPSLQKREEQVAPDQPVITLHGLCEDNAKGSGAGCETKVTREQFEALVQAFNPSHQTITPVMRRNLARAYVDLLTFAHAAEKAGIENTTNFKEVMRVLRLRTLSDLYGRSLEDQYRNPPPSEIEKYYQDHLADFQNMKLRRVYVPRFDPTGKTTAPDQKAAFDAKAATVAEDIYTRATKGEDMEQLQKDAYVAMDIKSNAPSTDMGAIRKGALPVETDKAISALSPGGVYKATDPTSYVIYKLEAREQLTLDRVKEEISRNLERTNIEAKKKEVSSSVKADLDEKYFGPAGAPSTPPLPRPDR